jgi:hypothetical protein
VNTDFSPEYLAIPWQRLETVLSVYIDMIECEKVVCVHNEVEEPGDFKMMDVEGQGQQWISTYDRPDALLADPSTGVTRSKDAMFGPWIVQPYTKEVLDQCLQTWELLVGEIEQKMPTPPGDDVSTSSQTQVRLRRARYPAANIRRILQSALRKRKSIANRHRHPKQDARSPLHRRRHLPAS